MKKISNIEFESLLQNEEFIRLLKDNSPEAGEMVEDLCRQNPGKEESIRLAVQLVHRYVAEQIDINDDAITMMWDNILRKSVTKQPAKVIRMATVWQMAAAIAVLVSLSIYYGEYSLNNSMRKFAEKKVEVSDEARIIISDGTEYKLKSNDSHIRYDSDGKEIVIEEKNDQTEKIDNQSAKTKEIYNQIVVPFGRRHRLTLSDGTVVQLNSGSKLVFPAKFSDSKREVFLTGEGYFDVTKDAIKPFIVRTEFVNVKVLGTHFNVSAYENEKSASTVLVEGSVEIYKNNFFKSDLCTIKPGEGCFFNGDSKLTIQNVDVTEYISWKDGFLQLKDQPFGNIIKKVEKYYNRKISFGDRELPQRIISGKLVLSVKLEETLDFLARTTKSRYLLKEDGTYIFAK